MSSLKSKDRVSLCSFTFSDGRRCRTPRFRDNPRFCPYHAQKEARASAAQSLGKDLDYFFSGDYLSACDLSTALGRLIPAVIRGDVKPRTARTVAYLMQTLLQAIHLSKHEYTNAFGTDGWRQSVRNSVNDNYDYLFPPAPESEKLESPQPQPVEPLANCPESHREESASSSNSSLATHHSPLPQAPQSEIPPAPAVSGTLSGPAPSPRTPLPPTSAEFAQHLLAGRSEGSASSSNSPLTTRHSPLPQVPSTPPKPAPVAQPFVSLALPPHVRRRLHRTPV
jgi:hypothetical protein